MTLRRATWRSGLRAIGICAALLVFSAVTAAVWFVVRHRDARSATASAASVEFEHLRSRFTGEQPLLDMRVRTAQPGAAAAPLRAPLRAFHTVVFDTRGRDRLVKITVPYWLGRRYARHDGTFAWLGELTFLDDTEFDPERIRLSLAEIERRGPGLLVDYRHPGGGQFMAWVD